MKRFKPRLTRIVYIDEKGPCPIIRLSGRVWASNQIIIDKRKKSGGMISFLGEFDPVDYKFYMNILQDHNSKSFCKALEYVIQKFLTKPYKRLLLVMDNAFIHKSKYTNEFLMNQKKVDVFFLPPYSPELNPIELCFNQYQRELVNNYSYYAGSSLFLATRKYVEYFNELRRDYMQL